MRSYRVRTPVPAAPGCTEGAAGASAKTKRASYHGYDDARHARSRAVWAVYGLAALIAACIMLGYAEGAKATEEPPRTPHGVPTSGVATWYGNTHPQSLKYCYDGYRNSCNPYSKGEKVIYAAVGTWKWGDKPYKVRVCVRGGTTCVIAVVRDYCHGAWVALRRPWTSKSRVIDLSPALFRQLAPLSHGVVDVEITEIGGVRRGY